jgi:fucose permease
LKYSALLGVVLAAAAFFTSNSTATFNTAISIGNLEIPIVGHPAILSIAFLGLANAVMWPAIFPLAINGLGRFTQIGSAILIMGIAGGALIPQLYGLLDRSLGHQLAFLICMLPCYLYILYYAIWGYKPR